MSDAFSILVIDDDINIFNSLRDMLRSYSWKIDVAESGQQGIEMVKKNLYNLILLDLHIPGVDCNQILVDIKALRPEAIVFLMTDGKEKKLEQLAEYGVPALVQKPLDVNDIIAMISNLEKKGVVLVVDDSENDRTLMSDILLEKGYRVLTAQTGAEAIEYVKQNKFDVVLLDIRLPDMDGITVLENIKEYKPTTSIIAVTGYSLDNVIENIVEKGAYTCFLKPFNVELLLKEVSYLINKKDEKLLNKDNGSSAIKILLVEDNDSLRETMKDILEAEGFSVRMAASVDGALELIENENFNIVISDLSLGKDSGLTLVDPVRKKDKLCVFILITGFGTMETALEAIKKGIDEYILKPVKPGELIHKVKTHLEKQKLNKEKENLVMKLTEKNIKLLELSKTDELTGLFNRRHLFEELHSELQRAKRQNSGLGLMMCDVDGFKKYNDKFGHVEGDRLLKEISALIKIAVRLHVDQVFRYGGDEFSIIVPDVDEKTSITVANRILEKIKDNLSGRGISISIGITCFSGGDSDVTINDIIDSADKKLYKAKKSGGGIFVL